MIYLKEIYLLFNYLISCNKILSYNISMKKLNYFIRDLNFFVNNFSQIKCVWLKKIYDRDNRDKWDVMKTGLTSFRKWRRDAERILDRFTMLLWRLRAHVESIVRNTDQCVPYMSMRICTIFAYDWINRIQTKYCFRNSFVKCIAGRIIIEL